jgi:formylglycine-generating enzyme required for sulfatase activity
MELITVTRPLQRLILVCGLLAGLVPLLTLDSLPAAETKTTKAPADFKDYTEKISGSEVSFDMVAIPGGTFTMGSPEDEKGRAKDEGPQHPIQLRPFWMGKCEVTWDEFDLFRNPDPEAKEKGEAEKTFDAKSRPTPYYEDETYGFGREKHPALTMSHHAAMEYCRWLSLKTGKTYRLPTECEWEYACRANTKTAYFFGDDPKKIDDYAWYAKNSDSGTQEVGKKKPNPWRLHDMYGNVYEWCVDHYARDTYGKYPRDKASFNPVILPTDKRFAHVTRGGCWADDPERCRSAARLGSNAEWIKLDPNRPQSIWWLTRWSVVGFRVVRPVEEYDNLKGLKSKVTRLSD